MTLDEQGIVALIENYEKQSKAFKKEALKIAWHMRGSITYDDAMALSFADRQTITEIINDNMEVTKKTGLPFF